MNNRVKTHSPARKNSLLRRFAESVPQEELAAVLAGSGNVKGQRLLEMMLDPVYRRHSLAKLCERAGLKQTELLDLFRRYHLDMAMLNACRQLPQVIEDAAEAALNRDVACQRCDGLKQIPATIEIAGKELPTTRPCPECDGRGKLLKAGDKNARRDFLEVMGVRGPKSAQLNVHIDHHAPQRLEDLVTVAAKILDE